MTEEALAPSAVETPEGQIGCHAPSTSAQVKFCVGDKFSTFKELESAVESYKKHHFVDLWRRDSRTIEASRKRGVDRPLKAELKYFELKYCCIHGGQRFVPRGRGKRSTSTFRQDCPAHVALKISKDGSFLEVRSVNTEHNHDLSQELFKHLPSQRKLCLAAKAKASNLLRMNANKKMVQAQLTQETGNVILLRDLTNIASAAKQGKSRNRVDSAVRLLTEKYGASVEVFSDNDKNLKGLFFQDKQMRDTFKAYPELLCLDATYKLLELRLPVYLMLSEDSNGQSEIAAVCLLVQEDATSVTWMVETFKKLNLNWEKVRVIMADKDIGERDVLKKSIPNASVLICLFHTLRSFKREITCEKMGISSGQRSMCLELLQQMCYAHSESEYADLHSRLQSSAPKDVVTYFNDNWHGIRSEWVLGMKSSCGNFLNFTNNRLESINGKLKQVINRHSTLEDFIEKFFIILTALRTERDHKAAIMFQKVIVNPFPEDSPESQYSKLLTSYAAKYVHKQLTLSTKVNNIAESDGCYTIDTSEGEKRVSPDTCECIFRSSMLLPCRHMFALRSKLQQPLFKADLCDERWTTAYYKCTQRLFSTSSQQSSVQLVTTSKEHCRKLSQHQKFRTASIITAELASVASTASNVHFERRIDLLEELLSHWKAGTEVALTEVDSDDSDDEVYCGSRNTFKPPSPVTLHSESSPDESNTTSSKSAGNFNEGSTTRPPLTELNQTRSPSVLSQNTFKPPSPVTLNPEPSPDESNTTSSKSAGNSDEGSTTRPPLTELSQIRSPSVLKRRGRPKGHHLTTIGLPAKKKAKKAEYAKRPTSFRKLHTSEKEEVILGWFLNKDVVQQSIKKGTLAEEEEVECMPERIPDSVTDENVDVCLVRKHFTCDAWLIVEQVVDQKIKNMRWVCKSCQHDLDSGQSVVCDSCLLWFHFSCVGIVKYPKSKEWFCRTCFASA